MRWRSFVLAPVLAAMGYAAAAADNMTGDQFKATFVNGKPVSATMADGKQFVIVLNTDGSGQVTPKGQQNGNKGTWRVTATGYCTKWGTNPEACFTMQKDGAAYPVFDASGKKAGTWQP